MALSVFSRRGARWNSFTLVEMLVVIAIIAILAALTLAGGEAVMAKAARSRAQAEINGISAALEAYKTDAGSYPWTNISQISFGSTNDYISVDCSSPGGFYMVSAQIIYEALSGKTNYTDVPVVGNKVYMNLKGNQVGNANPGTTAYSMSGSTYVQDPFGYSYGYYAPSSAAVTANASATPINGVGQFDLWSTGGLLEATAAAGNPGWTNTWLRNWTQ